MFLMEKMNTEGKRMSSMLPNHPLAPITCWGLLISLEPVGVADHHDLRVTGSLHLSPRVKNHFLSPG